MNELEQLRSELELARAEADYYRNLVLLDDSNPDSVKALEHSQDVLDRLDPEGTALPQEGGNVFFLKPEQRGSTAVAHAPGKRLGERLRYLAMIPVNIIIAIPVSIVAAVALARIMSASLLKKGFLDVLVRNTSQSVRISVDQHRNTRED